MSNVSSIMNDMDLELLYMLLKMLMIQLVKHKETKMTVPSAGSR